MARSRTTPDNQIDASTVAGTTATYLYDADGWRVAKTSSGIRSLFTRGVNGELMSEIRPSVQRDYVYAGGRLLGMIRHEVNGGEPNVSGVSGSQDVAGLVQTGFSASSPSGVYLASASLLRAPKTSVCTAGGTSGCNWSAVDTQTAPTNVVTWSDNSSLTDTPGIGVAYVYTVRVLDIDGAIGTATTGVELGAPDTTPDAFAFSDQSGIGLNTAVNSNILQITGIAGNVPASVAGAGSYRLCTNATCSTNPAFTTSAATIVNGQYVQLQATSSQYSNISVGTTLTIGNSSATWSVTTGQNAPIFRSASQASLVGSGTNPTFTITKPAGTTPGDVLVATIAFRRYDAFVFTPTGWTLVSQTTNSDPNTIGMNTYYRVAGTSEPASYSWTTADSPSHLAGIIASFSNVSTASPVNSDKVHGTASSLSHATLPLTTALTNTMRVALFAYASSGSWSAITGFTKAGESSPVTPPNSSGVTLAMFYGAQAASGTLGPYT